MTDTVVDVAPPEDPEEGVPARSRFLPQTPAQAALGVLVLMFLAGTIGLFIGTRLGDDSPSATSVDAGFLFDMSAHHQQAVILSEIELTNGTTRGVQGFAREIMRTQSYEIGLMAMRLGTWGHDPATRPERAMAWMGMSTAVDAMPGMADASELRAFRAARGADADALFVALMRDHHTGGVEMAEYAATHANNKWVRDTAASMARIQREEIVEMERARAAAGLSTTPPGYTADDLTTDGSMGDMGDMGGSHTEHGS